MQTQRYGLFTAITMIVGIVIGSGIFFKSDNILVATNGNVTLGVILFVIAAISIIFGSLSIAQLARLSDRSGGVIAYMEDGYGKGFSNGFGWFQLFIYYPTLAVVVGWVFGVYCCTFFSIESTLTNQLLVGLAAIIVLYGVNILAAKLGGLFQNAATIIKLIPLVLIAFAGLFFGDMSNISTANSTALQSAGWLTAIAPIAFSFDGWIIATSISHEIKNSKRNLPLALIVAPLIILVIYIAYFIGINALIGPEQVMALGDDHVTLAAQKIFGGAGGKLIIIFVMVSVLGTVNGIIIGSMRLPFALAQKGMLPWADKLQKLDPKTQIPMYSALFAFIVTMLWAVAHYFTQTYNLLPNSDISEIAIVMSYLLYIALYIYVICLYQQKKISGFFGGIVTPILAIIGSLFIFYGGSQHPLFIYYTIFCGAIIAAGMFFAKSKR